MSRRRVAHSSVRSETQLRRAKMQKLFSEGHTVEEISKIMDRSVQTVRNAVEFMENYEPPTHRKSRRTRKVRVVETGMVFESATACAEYFAISPTMVSDVLKGRQEKTSGLHIEYTGEWTE